MFSKLKKIFYLYKKYKEFKIAGSNITGVSLAQNFEDLIFLMLMNRRTNCVDYIGTYVDVGAYDPVKFSNTFNLYRKGWRGINIDPLKSSIDRFNKLRPDDINLSIGIDDKVGEIEYFRFEESAYNTINPIQAEGYLKRGYPKFKEKNIIKTDTLKNVFDAYLNGRKIDLLTIDVENMELSVLQSNDWDKYRPTFIIMESIVNCDESLDNIYQDPAVQYLIDKDYIAVAKVVNAVFFSDNTQQIF